MELDDQLFAIGTEVAEALLTRLRNERASAMSFRAATLYFFCSAYKTYQAVRVLWKNGYVEDATNLARSIYEIRLQVAFMSRQPTERAEQFFDHRLKCAIGTLQILRELHHSERQTELPEGERELRGAAQRFEKLGLFEDLPAAKRAIKEKWWGVGGIKKILTELGLEKEYDLIYSQLSDHAHSGVRLFQRYVQLSEDSMTMSYRPVKSRSITVPSSVMDWLIQIIGYTGQAFDLNFDAQVRGALQKGRNLLKSAGREEG